MAETIDDLTGKQITEAAILQLINHWLMEYKPEDTVDPTSDGVPTGKAIAKYIQSIGAISTSKYFYITDNSAKDFDEENRGTILDVTSAVGSNFKKKNFDVIFDPKETYLDVGDADPYRVGIHCDFVGIRYAMSVRDITSDKAREMILQRINRGVPYPLIPGAATGSPYVSLQYTYFHNQESPAVHSFTKFHRTAFAYKDGKKTYLYLSPLMRSYVDGSGSVVMNGRPTQAQAQRTTMLGATIIV